MFTQASFAALTGVSKQMVSKYKKDDRLAFANGGIDAAASLARLEGVLDETKRRAAIAELGEREKVAAAVVAEKMPEPAPPPEEPAVRTDRQRREKVEADKAEVEFLELTGRLVDAADMRKAIEDAVARYWSEVGRRERDDADQIAGKLRLDAAQARTLRAEIHRRTNELQRDFSSALAAVAKPQGSHLSLVGAA